MSEFEALSEILCNDGQLWQGLNLSQANKEAIIARLFAGEIAIEAETGQKSEPLGEHFCFERIDAKDYLLPARYHSMLNFFVRSACRPAARSHQKISPGVNCLITGGPGTGKSYQIARFVEALAASNPELPLRVTIAAPTGKAAARFTGLGSSAGLLIECLTIHRLLQLSTDGGRAKYHATNPLPVDVLIVDEISMVDLGLFVRLIAALPLHAQLVLAGDTGQLPAVDGIAIAPALGFLKSANLLAHIELTQTHRFSATKAAVYSAIQQGGIAAIDANAEGIHITEIHGARALFRYLEQYAKEAFGSAGFRELADNLAAIPLGDPMWLHTARQIMAVMQKSIILCESNQGNFGTQSLNEFIANVVGNVGQKAARQLTPVMVTANSYELQLFNGDTGFIVNDGKSDIAVIESGNELRIVPLGRLRHWQMAYAITVHKSQGSEYPEVHIIHEERPGEKSDHRLLYTAVTRARERAIILNVK
jgi:exodeoxyribonuclease V alpha subunit